MRLYDATAMEHMALEYMEGWDRKKTKKKGQFNPTSPGDGNLNPETGSDSDEEEEEESDEEDEIPQRRRRVPEADDNRR
ncbi:hypothetical protein LWI28_012206 [Acer negundo]|uniref:Uncharacterized protein n=1 Tax=Acer negundo TaxID=4023 RepID=A0AAD5IUE7_ACENE|nr:hypothetical protein LWI28_012206 [Acer negundo]